MLFARIFFAVALSVLGGFANAEMVDLGLLPAGDLGTTQTTVSGVTFSGTSGLAHINHFAASGGTICSFDPGSFNCANDMTVSFNGKVKRLRFSVAGAQPGDSVAVQVFRRSRDLGVVQVTADGLVNLASFRGVTRLVLDDNSTAAGISIGKIKFRRPVAIAATRRHRAGS